MDQLKKDFDVKASEICSTKGNYNVLEKKIVLIPNMLF